jgi:hypothetical protein
LDIQQDEGHSPHHEVDPVSPQGEVEELAECCVGGFEEVGEGAPRRHTVRLGDILDVEGGGVPDLQLLHPPPPDTTERGASPMRPPRRRRRSRSVGLQTRLGGRSTVRHRLGWPY